MTDVEKSAILAEMVGWEYRELDDHPDADQGWVDENGLIIWTNDGYWSTYHFDLYDTENMALAWRVLNWAMNNGDLRTELIGTTFNLYVDYRCGLSGLMSVEGSVAQRAWLDKILELVDLIEQERQDKYNEAYMSMWKAGGNGNAKRD